MRLPGPRRAVRFVPLFEEIAEMSLIPFRTRRPAGIEPAGLSTLSEFRNEMNRVFDGLFTRPLSIPTWFEAAEPGHWLPAIDMSEDPQRIQIRAELPGIDPKNVDVDVTEDRLVISGEKKHATSKSGNGWTHTESQYGAFSRTIPLPDPVDPAKVTANFENGVLTVELAKTAASTSRKIPVQVK
jgi:HSP20 family protein